MADMLMLLGPIRSIHEVVRDRIVATCERLAEGELARVVADGSGDTVYAIDRVSEELLVELFERHLSCVAPLVLIAEGLDGGKMTLPRETSEGEAVCRVIVDPIDGT